LVGNLLSPLANVVFLANLRNLTLLPPWLSRVCLASFGFALVQMAVRAWASARIYGWRFAAAVPLRIAWGNIVNFVATVTAIRQFAVARLQGRGMAWRKTEHVYPRPRLGELLVRIGGVPAAEVELAAGSLTGGQRIGEYLVGKRKLSEEGLYQALSVQSGIPAGPIGSREVDRLATRAFPAETARRWKMMPFRVERGRLHVAVADLPSPELRRELAGLSVLEIRYRLVPPAELARLESEYLTAMPRQ